MAPIDLVTLVGILCSLYISAPGYFIYTLRECEVPNAIKLVLGSARIC